MVISEYKYPTIYTNDTVKKLLSELFYSDKLDVHELPRLFEIVDKIDTEYSKEETKMAIWDVGIDLSGYMLEIVKQIVTTIGYDFSIDEYGSLVATKTEIEVKV